MVCHEHRCVFVHIPKTGGTSIQRVLMPAVRVYMDTSHDTFTGWSEQHKIWMQHATAQQIVMLHESSDTLKSYYKFCFVRNPWDRALSDYLWLREDIGTSDTFLDYLLERGDFEPVLQHKNTRDWRGDHVAPQSNYTHDHHDVQLVDYVGRFEDLQTCFNKVCDRINMTPCQLPHVNRTDHRHYTSYYDCQTREIVSRKYARDIQLFGYKYDC